MAKIRMTRTEVVEFEVDPDNYPDGVDTPEAAAEYERKLYDDPESGADLEIVFDGADLVSFDVTVVD